jgi:hypothetical protein
MNQAIPPTSPPPKKGLSGLAIAGIGCGALTLLIIVAAGLLMMKGCQKFNEVAADFEKNPERAAAMMALKFNPDLEVVSTDDAAGQITVKQKSTGETTTMSFKDISEGKFTVTNSKGETVTMDASKAANDGLVVTGPEGKMVLGGNQSAPPAWVPLYPGATASGGMKSEQGNKVSGTFATATGDDLAKVKAFYEQKLSDEGYETGTNAVQGEGAELVMFNANKDDGQRTLNVVIQAESGKTNVSLTYSFEPKE